MMKIAYLTGKDLAISSFRQLLHRHFGARSVYALRAADLAKTDLKKFDLLVFPGSAGEISPYPDILGEAELRNVRQAVEKDGLILWTDCSATYYMLSNIGYVTSAGFVKKRLGLDFLKGDALGPVGGTTLAPAEDHRFSEVVIREVSYLEGGSCCTARVCYGNGPGIYLSEEEKENPAVRVLGSYVGVPGTPAAAVAKKMGRGLVISLGVLVQIEPDHLEGCFADEQAEKHRMFIFNELSRDDTGRKGFLDLILRHIHNHYRQLNSATQRHDLSGDIQHVTFP